MNFNPFETYKGNSPDASGVYPGEPRYKDPTRGDVSFAIMMEEKAESEEREKNPKAGSEPGCPGCKKDIYAKWDPFETYKGNSPDASGVYPGEPRYKDPTRGDVSFA